MNKSTLFSDDSDDETQNKNKYRQYYNKNMLYYKQCYHHNIQILNYICIILYLLYFVNDIFCIKKLKF